MTERLETGPIYVEGDWPGIFIRGDNALFYAMMLDKAATREGLMPLEKVYLKSIARLLRRCDAGCGDQAQRIEIVMPAAVEAGPEPAS